MTANSNAIKPIMVGDITLTQLEQCWDSSESDDQNDKAESYDELLKTFQEVCARLRKEVKIHKKSKLKVKELVQEILAERQRLNLIRYESENWLPIETAPKDGTRLLLYREGYAESTFVGWFNTCQESWVACFSTNVSGITHWRKLPNNPPNTR